MTGSRESALHLAASVVADPAGVDTTVLTVRGNLDIDSATGLREAIERSLDVSACRVVVDLAGLQFCDSVGLSAFVDAHRACERRAGYFRLAAPTPFLTRVLAVVGLIGQLHVYPSVAAALADQPPGGIAPVPEPRPAR